MHELRMLASVPVRVLTSAVSDLPTANWLYRPIIQYSPMFNWVKKRGPNCLIVVPGSLK